MTAATLAWTKIKPLPTPTPVAFERPLAIVNYVSGTAVWGFVPSVDDVRKIVWRARRALIRACWDIEGKHQKPRQGKRPLLSHVLPQDLQSADDVKPNGTKSHRPTDVEKMMAENEKDFEALAEKLAGGVDAKSARIANESDMVTSLWQDARSLIAQWSWDWTRRELSGDFFVVLKEKHIHLGYKHPKHGLYRVGMPGDVIYRRPVHDAFQQLKRHIPGIKEEPAAPVNRPLSYVTVWLGEFNRRPCKQIQLHENSLSYQNGGDQRCHIRYTALRELLAQGKASVDHADKLPEGVQEKLGLIEEKVIA